MRTIGLIGGMSWESTVLYYQVINREVARRRGGLSSARLLMDSLDFDEVVRHQKAGQWDTLATLLAGSARALVSAGAECVLIGTNTMHRVAHEVQAAVPVPLIHIADVTGQAILQRGCRTVSLLGTRYTMEQPFYVDHLARLGIECRVPEQTDREEVHRIIFEELCQGTFEPRSRQRLREIVELQAAGGAEAVVLGCTELPLLLKPEDVALPLFDTTTLHAMAAVDFALASDAR